MNILKTVLLTPAFEIDFTGFDASVNPVVINTGLQIKSDAFVFVTAIIVTTAFTATLGDPTISIGTSSTSNLLFGPIDYSVLTLHRESNKFGAVMDSTLNVLVTVTGGAIGVGTFKCYILQFND